MLLKLIKPCPRQTQFFYQSGNGAYPADIIVLSRDNIFPSFRLKLFSLFLFAKENQPGSEDYMKHFTIKQAGNAGDITAGFFPYDYLMDSVYIEWYSRTNGRVVIELEQDQVQIIDTPIAANKCEPISREDQDNNLTEYMSKVAEDLGID